MRIFLRTFGLHVSVLILAATCAPTAWSEPQVYIVDGGMADMALWEDPGLLVWSHSAGDCPGGELAPPCRIKRAAAHAASPNPVHSLLYKNPSGDLDDATSVHSKNIAIDGDSIFWLGRGSVLRVSHGVLRTVATRPGLGLAREIAVDANWVFWTESIGGTSAIYRADREGGSAQLIYSTTTAISQLTADGQGGVLFVGVIGILYHLDESGGLYDLVAGPATVSSYALDGTDVYGVQGLRAGTQRLFRASLTDLSAFQLGATVARPVDNADFPAFAVDDTHLFYYRDPDGGNAFIYRIAKADVLAGTPVPITAAIPFVEEILAGERYLFWRTSDGKIWRLELATAEAFEADVSVQMMIASQSVQTSNNDLDLVNEKPTIVRVIPGYLFGPDAVTVRASLEGFDELGSPLPYAPAAQTTTVFKGLALRTDERDDFVFRLPAQWTTGSVDLRVSLTTVSVYDPDPGNNDRVLNVLFRPKTHICMKFLPIETTSALTYRTRNLLSGAFTPGFHDIVRRFESLVPTRKLLFYSMVTALRKPQFLGTPRPFNMVGSADGDHLIAAIWEHNVWDNAPAWCERDNARTLYAAMVHPGINTMVAPGVFRRGQGRFEEPNLWFQMNLDGTYGPSAGATLAHEMGHTLNTLTGLNDHYQHVNCGLPTGAGFNEHYPYDTDSIGLIDGVWQGGAAWGYDTFRGSLIDPSGAADYMSYCVPRWTSDYRWSQVIERVHDRPAPGAARLAEARAEAALESDVLAVFGLVSADEQSAEILVALHAPPGVEIPSSPSGGAGSVGTSSSYTLDLLSANRVLLGRTEVYPTTHEAGEDNDGRYYFATSLPYAPGTARFQLVRDGTSVLEHANVSAHAPVVQISRPTKGSAHSDTLVIQWNAFDEDKDRMTHTVQYRESADAGWKVIATQLEDSVLSIDTSNLPGGTSDAWVRVIASDGVNLGIAEVGPFSLANQPPQPFISLPLPGAEIAVDQSVVLEGGALDPEDGELSNKDLGWRVVGPLTTRNGTGAQFILTDLRPGPYTATLTATDSQGLFSSTSSEFVIPPKPVPAAPIPVLDGVCDPDTYAADAHPLVLRYPDLEAVVRFARSDEMLWVCVDWLTNIELSNKSEFWLYFDSDASGGSYPNQGDFGVGVSQSGAIFSVTGQPFEYVGDAVPNGILAATVSKVLGFFWSAELMIDPARLGGFDHLAAVRVLHLRPGFEAHSWPPGSTTDVPSSYGQISLGLLDQTIAFPQPADQVTGADPFPANATASSGLPVTLTSLTPLECQTSIANEIFATGPGTCEIEASQDGNETYLAATPLTRSFDVSPLPCTDDRDGDGACDSEDNCPDEPNGPLSGPDDQLDADGDGYGDACECGDASGDGFVNSIDARLIQRCAVGQINDPAICTGLCDTTGEGVCNTIDARLVQRMAVGQLGKGDLLCAARP